MDGLNDLTADDPDVVVDDWKLDEDKDRSVADRVADSDDCPIENDCTATNKTSAVRLRSDDLMMLTFAAVAGLAVEEGCLSDEPSEPKGLSLTYVVKDVYVFPTVLCSVSVVMVVLVLFWLMVDGWFPPTKRSLSDSAPCLLLHSSIPFSL